MTEQEKQERKDIRTNKIFASVILICIAILAIKNLVIDNI